MTLFNAFSKSGGHTAELPEEDYANTLTQNLRGIRFDKLIDFYVVENDGNITIELTLNCGGEPYQHFENIDIDYTLTLEENLENIENYIRSVAIWNFALEVINSRKIDLPEDKNFWNMKWSEIQAILEQQES